MDEEGHLHCCCERVSSVRGDDDDIPQLKVQNHGERYTCMDLA